MLRFDIYWLLYLIFLSLQKCCWIKLNIHCSLKVSVIFLALIEYHNLRLHIQQFATYTLYIKLNQFWTQINFVEQKCWLYSAEDSSLTFDLGNRQCFLKFIRMWWRPALLKGLTVLVEHTLTYRKLCIWIYHVSI